MLPHPKVSFATPSVPGVAGFFSFRGVNNQKSPIPLSHSPSFLQLLSIPLSHSNSFLQLLSHSTVPLQLFSPTSSHHGINGSPPSRGTEAVMKKDRWIIQPPPCHPSISASDLSTFSPCIIHSPRSSNSFASSKKFKSLALGDKKVVTLVLHSH